MVEWVNANYRYSNQNISTFNCDFVYWYRHYALQVYQTAKYTHRTGWTMMLQVFRENAGKYVGRYTSILNLMLVVFELNTPEMFDTPIIRGMSSKLSVPRFVNHVKPSYLWVITTGFIHEPRWLPHLWSTFFYFKLEPLSSSRYNLVAWFINHRVKCVWVFCLISKYFPSEYAMVALPAGTQVWACYQCEITCLGYN